MGIRIKNPVNGLISTVFALMMMSAPVFCQESLSTKFDELNRTIENTILYDQQKEKTIDSLEKRIRLAGNDLSQRYELFIQLYDNYKVFKYDSAYEYARRSQQLALALHDPEKIAYTKTIVNFILLSSGLFKETADSLQDINISIVSNEIKAEFYALKARYFYDLADYAKDNYYSPAYNDSGRIYIDSALKYYLPSSFFYSYYTGLKNIRSGNMSVAQLNFLRLINAGGLTDHELALTASTLSDIYIQNGNTDKAASLLVDAAIADIISSTKETSAMFNLAQLLYKKGDVRNASKYIEFAINDAAFYGARQRKVQLISILPLIEMEKISQVEAQKKLLVTYAISITLLLLVVTILGITIYRQVTKLKQAQAIINAAHLRDLEVNQQLEDRNNQLSEVNNKISEINAKLSEANKIKEEYIGYFFNANSEFFNRIERFKKSVEQKIADRKIDEIKFLVNNINLRREKEDLLKNFDKAFLKLFPHFITEFNTLFKEEDRFELKNGEILNTDLRIFALIRMGIHDIEKIAQILEYSSNTINTYKTRLKNKSIIPNEEFERRIMNIKTK